MIIKLIQPNHPKIKLNPLFDENQFPKDRYQETEVSKTRRQEE